MDHHSLAHCIEKKENLGVTDIIRQITQLLKDIHSKGNAHGSLTPYSITLDSTKGKVISIQQDNQPAKLDDATKEWRPTQENDEALEVDIFSLGCIFYYVFTGGQHPFGSPELRTSLISKHLYDLTGCKDKHLRKLITAMISHDSSRRPNCTELLDHPLLWTREKIVDYLNEEAEKNSADDASQKGWTSNILISDQHLVVDSEDNDNSNLVLSVAEIMEQIKEGKTNSSTMYRRFPDLLYAVYFSEDDEISMEESDDQECPEKFGNLLVSNKRLGEVEPNLGIKRRHGRFGLKYVHVMQFRLKPHEVAHLRRIRGLSHPNLLQVLYFITQNSSMTTTIACEAFDITLDAWVKNKEVEFEIAKEILNQITKGFAYYHSNKLVHGNPTLNQIAIFSDCERVIAKVFKYFPTEDPSSETAPSAEASLQNDVRKLGQIFSYVLARTKDVPSIGDHLIQAMKDARDEHVPPSEAIFYHPLFWTVEETSEFFSVARELYAKNPFINHNSSPLEHSKELQDNALFNANREDVAVFLALREPSLVTQTWLRLQKFKSNNKFGTDTCSTFFHPKYLFPEYDQLLLDEKIPLNEFEKSLTKDKPMVDMNQEVNLPGGDSGFTMELFTEFQQKGNLNQDAFLIKNYLEKYLENCHQAVKKNNARNKIPINLKIDKVGRTAIHLACHSDDFYHFAEKLIDLGIDPNSQDNNGVVPLHVAAITNSFHIAEKLIEKGVSVDIQEKITGRTPLIFATIYNFFRIVKLLVSNKARTDACDYFGQSPLHISVAINSIETTKFLLEKDSSNINKLNKQGMSPLRIAVGKNSLEMAKLLLDYEADPNESHQKETGNRNGMNYMGLLHLAVANRSVAMMYLLLSKGANPNEVDKQTGDPVLHFAVANKSIEMIDLLLKSKADINQINSHTGETVLHTAALLQPDKSFSTREDIIKYLLKKGANHNIVDFGGQTVLHAAITNKAEQAVEVFLQVVSIETINTQERSRGITPLHLAAWYKLENIAKMLIEKNANVDIQGINGETPLEYASASNAVGVVQLLLNKGVSAISKNIKRNNRSPLHLAATYGSKEVGELLLENNANIRAADSLGLTPHHYAEYCNQLEFVKFIEDYYQRKKMKHKKSNNLSPKNLAEIHLLNDGALVVNPTKTITYDITQFAAEIVLQQADIQKILIMPTFQIMTTQIHIRG